MHTDSRSAVGQLKSTGSISIYFLKVLSDPVHGTSLLCIVFCLLFLERPMLAVSGLGPQHRSYGLAFREPWQLGPAWPRWFDMVAYVNDCEILRILL